MFNKFYMLPAALFISHLLISGCLLNTNVVDTGKSVHAIAAKNLSSYNFNPDSPLRERVREIPVFLLNYIRALDHNPSYVAYIPEKEELEDIGHNLALLPGAYLKILQERLIGIFFVKNFTGSGLTDFVLDEHGNIYTIIILNPDVLLHNISDWMTLREKTCFTPESGEKNHIRIKIDCGRKYTGLTYILLHETSHAVDYVKRITPYVEEDVREYGPGINETSFTARVWERYDRPLKEYDFEERKNIRFYGLGGKPVLRPQEAVALYERLSKTPFTSLYGSKNWAEDFAEYMTWLYFTRVLKQPYTIQVLLDNEIRYSYSPMRSGMVVKRTEAITDLLE